MWSALALCAFMILLGELAADSIGAQTPLHMAWRLLQKWRETQ